MGPAAVTSLLPVVPWLLFWISAWMVSWMLLVAAVLAPPAEPANPDPLADSLPVCVAASMVAVDHADISMPPLAWTVEAEISAATVLPMSLLAMAMPTAPATPLALPSAAMPVAPPAEVIWVLSVACRITW